MKTQEISDKWGCIIIPSNDENIQDLEYNEIVFLFERYGALLYLEGLALHQKN